MGWHVGQLLSRGMGCMDGQSMWVLQLILHAIVIARMFPLFSLQPIGITMVSASILRFVAIHQVPGKFQFSSNGGFNVDIVLKKSIEISSSTNLGSQQNIFLPLLLHSGCLANAKRDTCVFRDLVRIQITAIPALTHSAGLSSPHFVLWRRITGRTYINW